MIPSLITVFAIAAAAAPGAPLATPPLSPSGPSAATVQVENGTTPTSVPAETAKATSELFDPFDTAGRFTFGSYGRINAFATPDWHPISQPTDITRPMSVVTFGPRLDETPYQELDFHFRLLKRPDEEGPKTNVVFTLALAENYFQYTGQFAANWAVRNLFVESQDVGVPHLTAWIGSRMYRGDDVYLFDFWPLDNLNTYGAGLGYQLPWGDLAIHMGVNQLADPYQVQLVEVANPGFGTSDIPFNNRLRRVESFKLTVPLPFSKTADPWANARYKIRIYGELHQLNAGQLLTDPQAAPPLPQTTYLPPDNGALLGAELGAWKFGRNAYANLWIRYAQGLATYGDLGLPGSADISNQSSSAQQWLGALAGNYELGRFGALWGLYAQSFRDSAAFSGPAGAEGVGSYSTGSYDEFAASIRPSWFVTHTFHLDVEASQQVRFPHSLSPYSAAYQTPAVTKLTIMPLLSPLGIGSLTRPQLRFLCTVAFLNEGAREQLYSQAVIGGAPADPRFGQPIQTYCGVDAEWWFNSSYGG